MSAPIEGSLADLTDESIPNGHPAGNSKNDLITVAAARLAQPPAHMTINIIIQ